MASTIKQRRQLSVLDDVFVKQRETIRQTGINYTQQISNGRTVDAFLLAELEGIGQAWQTWLTRVAAIETEATAAITEAGGDLSDFASRRTEIQSAADAFTVGLTAGNAESRLSAMASLTPETIF